MSTKANETNTVKIHEWIVEVELSLTIVDIDVGDKIADWCLITHCLRVILACGKLLHFLQLLTVVAVSELLLHVMLY